MGTRYVVDAAASEGCAVLMTECVDAHYRVRYGVEMEGTGV